MIMIYFVHKSFATPKARLQSQTLERKGVGPSTLANRFWIKDSCEKFLGRKIILFSLSAKRKLWKTMLPLVRDRKPIGRSTKDIFLHSAHQSLQQQKVEKVCRQQKNVIQGC